MNIKYETGRDYGIKQVLEIEFNPIEDTFDAVFQDVIATFKDAARGISGIVSVNGMYANQYRIGNAVLEEYDAGRYTAN